MNYLLFGVQPLIITNTLHKLIQQEISAINAFNYAVFDGEKTPISEIMLEVDQLPLGVDKKMVVIDNAYFLEPRPGNKGPKNNDLQDLENFLARPSPFVSLVFILHHDKVNKRSELYQQIAKVAKIYEIRDISDQEWPEYVRRTFANRNVKIDSAAVNELVSRMHGDAQLFESEAAKLATYSDSITLEDVLNMTNKSPEEKAYNLTNALLEKDLAGALEVYRDFKKQGQEPTSFISMIANQFRLYSQVFILKEQNRSQSDIAELLEVHPYRIKLALQTYRKGGVEEVNHVLEQLYQLDWQIKSGQVDRVYGFEMFLIDYCTK